MAEKGDDATELNVMDIFDATISSDLVCRVCGCLVAAGGDYPQAHYDWHEASNGA